MSISFNCACGKPLVTKAEMAGRKTKCPHCGTILTIPGTLLKPPVAAKSTEPAVPHHPDALVVEGLVWTAGETPISHDAGMTASATDEPRRPSDLPKPTDGSLQYKVLTQKDHSATGKVNFLNLEISLNEHAHHGWSVKSSFVVNIHSHSGNHDELVVILER